MSYFDRLGEISSSVKGAQRASDLVAALLPPPAPTHVIGAEAPAASAPTAALVPGTPAAAVVKVGPSLGKAAIAFAPTLVGGAAGALAWQKHRVLGFLAGQSLAYNGAALLKGDANQKKEAVYQLAVEGSGIAGALYLKKHMHPVFGWIVGIAAGSIATSFLPGSPSRRQLGKVRDYVKDAVK
jgi:xanthosine utilization system XapX-like protein